MTTTTDVSRIAQELPPIADRALLELANSLVVADDLNSFRREQSAIGGIVARITGSDRKRALLTERALTDGQRALVSWLTEVSGHVTVTDLAVAEVARHVQETRRRIDRTADRAAAQLGELAEVVAMIAEACEERIGSLDARVSALEEAQLMLQLRLDADTAFELALERWSAGRTYPGLPWILQIVLLAGEIAQGPAGRYARLSGTDTVSDRLVHRILASPRSAAVLERPGIVITRMIDDDCRDAPDAGRLRLVAEILGAGLQPGLAPEQGPLVSMVADATELWTRPDSERPPEPAAAARELAIRRPGWVPRTSDPYSLVERVVREQAEAARKRRDALAAEQQS
ncbi:hypothetical protein ABUW04_03570 [Streptacidiphilus sp. N1-10]|uniref:DUF222 domain-containing protein n=1 Tax=Streptacidiphilus jeojiensis TaxID=3229225 RepID=A0ABV6XGD7_9ACTN